MRSEPLIFIGVQSHYFLEAFRAIIFQSKRSELMIESGVCVSHSPSRPFIDVQSQRSEHRRSEPLFS